MILEVEEEAVPVVVVVVEEGVVEVEVEVVEVAVEAVEEEIPHLPLHHHQLHRVQVLHAEDDEVVP